MLCMWHECRGGSGSATSWRHRGCSRGCSAGTLKGMGGGRGECQVKVGWNACTGHRLPLPGPGPVQRIRYTLPGGSSRACISLARASLSCIHLRLQPWAPFTLSPLIPVLRALLAPTAIHASAACSCITSRPGDMRYPPACCISGLRAPLSDNTLPANCPAHASAPPTMNSGPVLTPLV